MLALTRTSDAESSHEGLKCCPLHAQARSSAGWRANHPARFTQSAQDVLSLRLLQSESVAKNIGRSGFRLLFKLRQRNFKFMTAREDHRALDKIFKFPHIAGPVVVY